MIDPKSAGSDATAAPKKPQGHRAPDIKDAVAEMTERAREISQEAGTAMAAAMKELIAAAAGLAGFAIESARDLVQFMVRRGQMTQDEADKLLKEVEAAQPKRKTANVASQAKSATSNSSKAPGSGAAKNSKTPAATAKKSEARPVKAATPPARTAPAAKKAAAKKNASTPKAKKAPAGKKKSR